MPTISAWRLAVAFAVSLALGKLLFEGDLFKGACLIYYLAYASDVRIEWNL